MFSVVYTDYKTCFDSSRYFIILDRDIEHRLHVVGSSIASVITPKRKYPDEEPTEDDHNHNKKNNNLRFESIENSIKELRNEQNKMTKLLEKVYQAQLKTLSQQKLVSLFLYNCDYYILTKGIFYFNSILFSNNQNLLAPSLALIDFYLLVVGCSNDSCCRSSANCEFRILNVNVTLYFFQ